ncbi:unnamed protein product [Dovyalis caffra]|uniref:Uncharacterized protein n=1 Tax=Dovyalis caffra TaxID=77055 RepID=A0AAV1SP48_9ROSI|nr:unnamed protein product [Dovyalis caffra]
MKYQGIEDFVEFMKLSRTASAPMSPHKKRKLNGRVSIKIVEADDGIDRSLRGNTPTIFLGNVKEGCSKTVKKQQKERGIRFSLGNASMHDHDQTIPQLLPRPNEVIDNFAHTNGKPPPTLDHRFRKLSTTSSHKYEGVE